MKLYAVYIGKELNSVHFNFLSAKILKSSFRKSKLFPVVIREINPNKLAQFLIGEYGRSK